MRLGSDESHPVRAATFDHEGDMTFDEAFERLMGHEGVLSVDPNDPGNWTGRRVNVGVLRGTKFGISAAQYPDEDIPNLTRERS